MVCGHTTSLIIAGKANMVAVLALPWKQSSHMLITTILRVVATSLKNLMGTPEAASIYRSTIKKQMLEINTIKSRRE
jgi:hypothetical protein